MKGKEIENYKKFAHFLEVIAKIAGCFTGTCLLIASVMLFLILFISDSTISHFISNANNSIAITLNNTIYFKVNSNMDITSVRGIFISASIYVILVSAVTSIIAFQTSKILSTVKDGTPFVVGNSKRLTLIGATIVASSFFMNAASSYFYLKAFSVLDYKLTKINFGPDLTTVAIGLMIIVLGSVFKYGAFLQKQYDETV